MYCREGEIFVQVCRVAEIEWNVTPIGAIFALVCEILSVWSHRKNFRETDLNF